MPPQRPFRWNARAGRYRDERGRFVSLANVRDSLDRTIDGAEREVRRLAEALRNREISLVQWERQMREHIKAVNLYSYATSVGGWQQLSPAQMGRVGAEVREQYRYLREFARQIESGKQPLDGRFASRAALYAKNGRKLQSIAQSEQFAQRGWDEEQNIRYAGDSCPGCIDATAAGWVEIGTLTPPGTRDCRGNCRCRLRYRNTATGEVTDGEGRRAAA